jgi:hypothetical protein
MYCWAGLRSPEAQLFQRQRRREGTRRALVTVETLEVEGIPVQRPTPALSLTL